jgi:dTDP-4-amino-4,6-dideoxygalactose transaminase
MTLKTLHQVITLPKRADPRGVLVPVELEAVVPFAVRRLYFIAKADPLLPRGFHAHRRTREAMVCISGSCQLRLRTRDGAEIRIMLSDPGQLVVLEPELWREMHHITEDAVLLVLASLPYDEDDYIRDEAAFLEPHAHAIIPTAAITKVSSLDLHRENAAFQPALSDAVQRVVASGWYVGGPEVKAFEDHWAAYCGVKHAVGVGNGLDAMELVLRAWGVGPGDEVIVPANTYIATWLAVDAVGARVVPVEPDPNTFNITVDAIEPALTSRTKVVLGVHLYGQSLDHRPIRRLCDQRGIRFLEDGAQSHGAIVDGVRVGAQGHAAAFSFYPTKNLGALGDAGAVTTDDPATAEAVARLGNYGSKVKYVNEVKGGNSRLDAIHAAALLAKLPALDAGSEHRRSLARIYQQNLGDIAGLQLPALPSSAEAHVWHTYVVQCSDRGGLQAHLQQRGIQTLIHYPIAPFDQQAYAGYGLEPANYPISRSIHANCLSLPISATHTPAEINYVCNAVAEFFAARRTRET